MNIHPFKFFNNGNQSLDVANSFINLHPLQENEMIIQHWNRDHSEIKSRVITWARVYHVLDWTQNQFTGSMNEFFTNRFDIPVVESISVLGPHGETNRIYYERDDVFLSTHTFINYPLRITYYEPI